MLINNILKTITFLLLFSSSLVMAKEGSPTRKPLRIDLDWTVEELLAHAPAPLPENDKGSSLRTFILYNVEPSISYRGKEIAFTGASPVFLDYQYEIPVSIRINYLDGHPKNTDEIKEKLKTLLPAIDALGFKRKKGDEQYSTENIPLPKTYLWSQGNGIMWESIDGKKTLSLLITVPPSPEVYRKEKKYFLSFAYYDDTDEKILKQNWLQRLNNRSNNNGKSSTS